MPLGEAEGRRELKQQLLAEVSRVHRALAAPARIELLELLAQTERSVEVLAELAGLSVANTSQHLRVLRRSGLVMSRRDGQFVRYRLPGSEPVKLLATLHALALSSSPALGRLIDGYRRSTDNQAPMTVAELIERSAAGQITLVDVRPSEEYAAGHLPAAVSLPLALLDEHAAQLGVDREIVAYCRGVLSLLSMEAVARLRKAGFTARRLELGFPEWQAAGLPLAKPTN